MSYVGKWRLEGKRAKSLWTWLFGLVVIADSYNTSDIRHDFMFELAEYGAVIIRIFYLNHIRFAIQLLLDVCYIDVHQALFFCDIVGMLAHCPTVVVWMLFEELILERGLAGRPPAAVAEMHLGVCITFGFFGEALLQLFLGERFAFDDITQYIPKSHGVVLERLSDGHGCVFLALERQDKTGRRAICNKIYTNFHALLPFC